MPVSPDSINTTIKRGWEEYVKTKINLLIVLELLSESTKIFPSPRSVQEDKEKGENTKLDNFNIVYRSNQHRRSDKKGEGGTSSII